TDDHLCLVRRALDLNARDSRVRVLVLYELPDRKVFMQPLGVLLVLVPLAGPSLDDAEPEPVRMCLLTHDSYASSRSLRTTVMWLMPLTIRVARPMARGRQRRMKRSGALSAQHAFT